VCVGGGGDENGYYLDVKVIMKVNLFSLAFARQI